MADGQHDEPVHAVGRRSRERPGDARAPVVADDVGRVEPERVEEAEHVLDAPAHPVRVDAVGPVGVAEPAQVRRDDREVSFQILDLVAPQVRPVRESVQQQDRWTAAHHLNGHFQTTHA